jgi:hypothetical protein
MENSMHKADLPKYQLRGYTSEEQLERDRGCDDERGVDTLKDARRIAKYWMTEAYRQMVESTSLVVIVQIWKGDECLDEMRAS